MGKESAVSEAVVEPQRRSSGPNPPILNPDLNTILCVHQSAQGHEAISTTRAGLWKCSCSIAFESRLPTAPHPVTTQLASIIHVGIVRGKHTLNALLTFIGVSVQTVTVGGCSAPNAAWEKLTHGRRVPHHQVLQISGARHLQP